MLSRPLELASRLRPAPRNFDHVFLINLGLIALFFKVFDSPYVFAPVLELGNFELPVAARSGVGAPTPTLQISVTPGGQGGPAIIVDSGFYTFAQFKVRLKEKARTVKSPVLMMLVDARVPTGDFIKLRDEAIAAGFEVNFAVQAKPPSDPAAKD